MPGLEPYGRAQALETLFNLSETTYVGLLSVLPINGVGEVEIAPAGYVRVLQQDWTTSEVDGVTSRCNVPTIGFGPYAEDVTIRGWAIWDASVGGNLIASGLFLDVGGGLAGEITVDTGDDIQFQPSQFCIALTQDCPIVEQVQIPGDVCSAIASITVSDGGGPPQAWTPGSLPIDILINNVATVVVTLTAASTDMAGFKGVVKDAVFASFVGGGVTFTFNYAVLGPALQDVVIYNPTNYCPCIYELDGITQGVFP